MLLKNGDENDKAYYIVNDDKISKILNRKKIIEIKNIKLINLLKKSFELFPREYLFETEKHRKPTEQQL